MKYIEKTVTASNGHDNVCWVAVQGSFNLTTGTGEVLLLGYKDAAAKAAGKPHDDVKTVPFQLEALEHFEALWTDVASALIATGAPFEGGTLKDL